MNIIVVLFLFTFLLEFQFGYLNVLTFFQRLIRGDVIEYLNIAFHALTKSTASNTLRCIAILHLNGEIKTYNMIGARSYARVLIFIFLPYGLCLNLLRLFCRYFLRLLCLNLLRLFCLNSLLWLYGLLGFLLNIVCFC